MDFLAQIITWINSPANALGKTILAPVGTLPGWLSNTIISAVAGVVLLIIFKYTSNQTAIGRARDSIKANMLALKLFKDSIAVTLQSQGRVFKGAGLLLVYAIRPLLVMIVPVCLLLGQMGLWYQFRPLQTNEESIITMTLNGEMDSSLPKVIIESSPAVEIEIGPVRSISKREVHWKIKVLENGYHNIVFQVDNQKIEKELAVGDGLMRVSPERPGWKWTDILLFPWEKPFSQESLVKSISIDYPDRISHTSGTDWWIGYFFVVSMIFAFIFKPVFKVRI
jgi:uncharacterized membrane protein (DUF106 family)